MIRKAKIMIELSCSDWARKIKRFSGTEEEIYEEAHRFMNEFVEEFIRDNEIANEWEKQYISESASHIIEWEETNPRAMYAVMLNDCLEPIQAVFVSKEDAEEYIITDAEQFVYEVMMCDDPKDVFGSEEWDWSNDYKYLLTEGVKSMYIQEVPAYDVKLREIEEE